MDSYTARFGGMRRLVSNDGQDRLRRAHVCVIGLGGVGSWAVEALARSGVGELTLVDMDDVCISNVNRQLHAIEGELGKPKAEAMARRVRAINPECNVHALQLFFTQATAEEILSAKPDYVLDAIDSPSRKALLIALCRDKGIPVITSGGIAGRRDPSALRMVDLAFSSEDRLLAYVRRALRAEFGFPRGDKPFGVKCIHSSERPVYPKSDGTVCHTPESKDMRLDCRSGFGTASFVTGTVAFLAVAEIVRELTTESLSPRPALQTATANASSSPLQIAVENSPPLAAPALPTVAHAIPPQIDTPHPDWRGD